jgi:hypothetical protein
VARSKSFNSIFIKRSSSTVVTICKANSDLNGDLIIASASSSRLLVLELCDYTNMAPVYVIYSYQESSCLVYAWKVGTVTDLVRDGHLQFVCVCGGVGGRRGAISWRFGRLVAGCQHLCHDSFTALNIAEVKCS